LKELASFYQDFGQVEECGSVSNNETVISGSEEGSSNDSEEGSSMDEEVCA